MTGHESSAVVGTRSAAVSPCRRVPLRVGMVLLLLAAPAAAQRWAIEDPGQGPVPLAAAPEGAHELSGLAWVDGDRYVAVSDDDALLYRLRIAVEPRSGRITSAALGAALPLAGGLDLEGVVVAPGGASVFVADETAPSVREYDLASGHLLRQARIPTLFTQRRDNLGFEALARDAEGALWTANEEALRPDGPTSTEAVGGWVRLLRLDARLQPTGQWAYQTDAVAGEAVLGDRGTGVSELVALPDGRLLALERSLGSTGLRIRLYELEVTGASEVSRLPSLAGAALTPVRKFLLWERTSLRENFEGAALGPPLADGSRSLVLVSDDGHRLAQSLYALRLRAR